MEKQEPFDQKSAQILKRACSVFAEKGYHDASVRDIAAATGVSPAGLYYYFRSKEELLFMVLDGCLESLVEHVQEEARQEVLPERRIRAMIRAHLRFCTGHWEEMKVLAHDLEALSGAPRRRVLRRIRAYSSLVFRTLEGLGPRRTPLELRAATFALFGMLNWVHTWYRSGRDLQVDHLADHFSNLFLNGFLSRGPQAEAEPLRNQRGVGREALIDLTRPLPSPRG